MDTQIPTLNVYSRPGFMVNLSSLGSETVNGPSPSDALSSGLKKEPLTRLRHILPSLSGVLAISCQFSSAVNSIPPSEVALDPIPTARIVVEYRILRKERPVTVIVRSVVRIMPTPACASIGPSASPSTEPDRASKPTWPSFRGDWRKVPFHDASSN